MDIVSELLLAPHPADERSPIPITTDLLDFDFIQNCDDPKVVRCILRRLQSRKDGVYPDLERETLDRLVLLSPTRVQAQVKALRAQPCPMEVAKEEEVLQEWSDEIERKDAAMGISRGVAAGNKILGNGSGVVEVESVSPPARSARTIMTTTRNTGSASALEIAKAATAATAAATTVAAVLAVEEKEKGHEDEDEDEGVQAAEKEIRDMSECLRDTPLSHRPLLAAQKKEDGNNLFKQGKYSEARAAYTLSLGHAPDNAAVCANRALAMLKQGIFDQAEADCTMAIKREPSYAKAWLRRGMVRHKLGKLEKARGDLRQVLVVCAAAATAAAGAAAAGAAAAAGGIGGGGGKAGTEEKEARALLAKMDEEDRKEEGGERVWGGGAAMPPPSSSSSPPLTPPPPAADSIIADMPVVSATASLEGQKVEKTAVREQDAGEGRKKSDSSNTPGPRPVAVAVAEAGAAGKEGGEEGRRDGDVWPPPVRPGFRCLPIEELRDGKYVTKAQWQQQQQQQQQQPDLSFVDSSSAKSSNSSSHSSNSNDRAQILKEQGNNALFKKRYHSAIKYYTEALAANANNSDSSKSTTTSTSSCNSRSSCSNNNSANSSSITTTLTTSKLSLTLFNNRAQAHLKLEQWEEALRDACFVLDHDPGNVKARFRKGKALCREAAECLGMVETLREQKEAGKQAREGGWRRREKEEEDMCVVGKQGVVGRAKEGLENAVKEMNAILAVESSNAEAQKERGLAKSLLSQYHQLFKQVEHVGAAGVIGTSSFPPSSSLPPPLHELETLLAAHRAEMAGEERGREGGTPSLMQEVTTRPRVQSTETFREIAVVEEGREQGQEEQQNQHRQGQQLPIALPQNNPSSSLPSSTSFSYSASSPPSSRKKKIPPPPTSISELETHWRTLKKGGDAVSAARLASYLSSFRPQTFSKVIKRVTSEETISEIYAVLAQELCKEGEGGEMEGKREVVQRVLEGMAGTEGFQLRVSMMSAGDLENVKAAFDFLDAAGAAGGSVTKKGGSGGKKGKISLRELRRKYLE